jgi:hypothetical protein
LERRIARWRALNDPNRDVTFFSITGRSPLALATPLRGERPDHAANEGLIEIIGYFGFVLPKTSSRYF